jgi:hypothetical protein
MKGMRNEELALERERIARDVELVAALERGLSEGSYEGTQSRMADLLAARLEKSGRLVAWGGGGPMGIAPRYLKAGDHDRAMHWLEKAYEAHSANLPYVAADPLWDPMRSNPRFQALVRKLGLPQR